jgi:hypothetical protein
MDFHLGITNLSKEAKSMKIKKICKSSYVSLIVYLCLIIGLIFDLGVANDENKTTDSQILFEQKFTIWRDYCRSRNFRSDINSYLNNESFLEIKKMGTLVIPLLISKIEAENKGDLDFAHASLILHGAMQRLTKVNLHILKNKNSGTYSIEDFPTLGQRVELNLFEIWLYWWREGRKQTPQRFVTLYKDWTELKKQGKGEETKEKYQRIVDIGIIILPYLIEKIAQCDTALIPAVSKLTDGEVKIDAKSEECIEWWNKNKEKWYIPIEDEPEKKEEEEPKGQEK